MKAQVTVYPVEPADVQTSNSEKNKGRQYYQQNILYILGSEPITDKIFVWKGDEFKPGKYTGTVKIVPTPRGNMIKVDHLQPANPAEVKQTV